LKAIVFLKSIVFLLMCLIALASQAQVYSSSVTDSRWQLESGAFSCKLTHSVDGFGQWIITRKPGQAEDMRLRMDAKLKQTKKLQLPAGRYTLMTAPPAWKPQLAPEQLGDLQLATADADLVIPQTFVPAIYALLEQTMPVILSNADKPLRIQMQPYQFKESYKSYKQCVTNLIPYTFEQITRTTLNYQIGETALSSANKKALDKIVRYAKADPNRIVSMIIDGHSDTQIDPALAETQAKNQADWVASYLKENGIAEDKLTVRAHADKYPVANNLIAKEKAKNRRVTVRLEDEAIKQKNAEKLAEKKKQEEEAKAAAVSSASSSAASSSPPPEFGDKLPIELELERMAEGQDLEKPSPSEMPSP
jgi:outer membrane protein OmpA-like peptidoglycan-associated protein